MVPLNNTTGELSGTAPEKFTGNFQPDVYEGLELWLNADNAPGGQGEIPSTNGLMIPGMIIMQIMFRALQHLKYLLSMVTVLLPSTVLMIYCGPAIILILLLMDTLSFRLLDMLVILRLVLSVPRLKTGSGVFMEVECTNGTPMGGFPTMVVAIPIGIYTVVI